MPSYLGQRDGLEWFETDNGPMGLMPSMANQYRGQVPGFGADDMAGAGGAVNPAAGMTAMPGPTSGIDPNDVSGAPTMGDMPPPSGAIGSVTGFGRGGPGYSPTEEGQPYMPPDDVRLLPAVTVDNKPIKTRGAKAARAREGAPVGRGGAVGPDAVAAGGQGGGFDGSLESAIGEGMRAYDAQGRAIMDTAALDAQDADTAAGMLESGEAKRLELQAQHDAQRQKEAQQLATYQNELGRMVEEHTKKEVDRGRLWKSKSTGEKIGLGLAVALAGLGSAMKRQGDKNPALDIVMGAIESDVSDQMNSIQKSGADIQMRQGMLQGFVQTTGNAEAARGMAMARGIADVEQQIKVAMSKTASPRALANGQMMLGELGVKRGESLFGAAQALTSRDAQAAQLAEQVRARKAAAGAAAASRRDAAARDARDFAEGQRRFDIETGQKAATMNAGDAAAFRESRKLMVPGAKLKDGSPLLAPTEKEGQDLRKAQGATTFLVGVIDDMEALIKKEGGIAQAMKSAEYQRIQSMSGSLTAALKEAMELGTLDNGVERLVKQITGGGDLAGWKSFVGSDATSGLNEVRRNQIARFNTKLKAMDENADFYDIPKAPEAKPTTSESALQTIETLEKKSSPGVFDTIAGLASPAIKNAQSLAKTELVAPAQLQLLDDAMNRGDVELLRQVANGSNIALAEAALERMQNQRTSKAARQQSRNAMTADFTVPGR